MSGYLDHVLARAFGVGPVLRPRLRSRFEPAVAGPADLAVWPESTNAPPAEVPAPGPADGPARHQPDPRPRAVPGSAPEPRPGRRQARTPAVPLAVAAPEPSGAAQTAGPFGSKEPDTERTSGDQLATDPTPGRPSVPTAVGPPARLPSAAVSVGPVTRGTVSRPVAGPPEPGEPAPARRPVRRASPLDGEPSPVPAGPPVPIGPLMTAGPPVPAASPDVADAPAAAGRPAVAGPPEPAESPARAGPPAADPAGPPAVARASTGADPTDVTGGPLGGLLAIPGPVAAAPTGAARRPSPSLDVAPVVNVTIGRVEVRPPPAPPPPPPPVRATGPRPLSLDEYLERRNSGAS